MATVNNGEQGWKVLEQYYTDDSSLTGLIMPNIAMISPQAIVNNSATITYNDTTDVSPSGGANGDIWYNQPSDALYKKISGTWTLLTDRVTNTQYVAPVENLTACPLP
jgi:hypothetical protein